MTANKSPSRRTRVRPSSSRVLPFTGERSIQSQAGSRPRRGDDALSCAKSRHRAAPAASDRHGQSGAQAGETTSPETLARVRRVDIRLLAVPWSSWEDGQAQIDRGTPEPTAAAVPAVPAPATIATLPVQPEPAQLPEAARVDQPTQGRLPLGAVQRFRRVSTYSKSSSVKRSSIGSAIGSTEFSARLRRDTPGTCCAARAGPTIPPRIASAISVGRRWRPRARAAAPRSGPRPGSAEAAASASARRQRPSGGSGRRRGRRNPRRPLRTGVRWRPTRRGISPTRSSARGPPSRASGGR